MEDTSRLIINHIRIMIEEAEHTKSEVKVSCFFALPYHMPNPYCLCITEIVYSSTALSCDDVL